MVRTGSWEHGNQPANISLSRVLAALETQIQDEQSLRSPYTRNKLSANLEYARSLLLRLEHDSTSIKIASRKQTVQSDLQKKREQIKRLQARLQHLNQLQDDVDDDGDEDEDQQDASAQQADAAPPTSTPGEEPSGLRPRKPGAAPDEKDTSLATARESLFSSASQKSVDPSTMNRETLLTANRTEQEDLTQSLLSLAKDLKLSSINFSSSLQSEKDVLEKAGAGLDSNVSGMEVTSKRMGGLRRLSEGTGWWGRMLLYAYIAGLWIVAFVLVVGLPKLRF